MPENVGQKRGSDSFHDNGHGPLVTSGEDVSASLERLTPLREG